MGADDRLAVHFNNLSAPGSFNSGHRRTMAQIMPIHDVQLDVLMPPGKACASIQLVHAGETIESTTAGGRVSFRIPILRGFETALLRLS